MSETFAQYHTCPDGGDCPVCGISPEPVNYQNYQPKTKILLKDYIYSITDCIENGLEYARECAAVHETNLGRTTLKNRLWAERMEDDIRKMEQLLKELKEL